MFIATSIGVLVLLTALVYKFILEPAFFSPLARIPAPNLLSKISSRWIDRKRLAGEIRVIFALHQKYGSVVRLGPNEISVNLLDGLRTTLFGGFEKHHWYAELFINFNMVTLLDHESHSVQKHYVSNMYSNSFLQTSDDLGSIADNLMLHQFLRMIDSAACDDRTIDMFDLLQALGMDFIAAYLFRSQNGTRFLEGRISSPLVCQIRGLLPSEASRASRR